MMFIIWFISILFAVIIIPTLLTLLGEKIHFKSSFIRIKDKNTGVKMRFSYNDEEEFEKKYKEFQKKNNNVIRKRKLEKLCQKEKDLI